MSKWVQTMLSRDWQIGVMMSSILTGINFITFHQWDSAAWIFFITFILIVTFAIAIIIDNIFYISDIIYKTKSTSNQIQALVWSTKGLVNDIALTSRSELSRICIVRFCINRCLPNRFSSNHLHDFIYKSSSPNSIPSVSKQLLQSSIMSRI